MIGFFPILNYLPLLVKRMGLGRLRIGSGNKSTFPLIFLDSCDTLVLILNSLSLLVKRMGLEERERESKNWGKDEMADR